MHRPSPSASPAIHELYRTMRRWAWHRRVLRFRYLVMTYLRINGHPELADRVEAKGVRAIGRR